MQKLCRFREYACWRLSAFAGSKNHVGQSVRGGFVQHFSATSVSIHLPHKERKNLFSVAVKSDQRSGLRATSSESALIFSDQSVSGWNLFSILLYLSSPLTNFAGCNLYLPNFPFLSFLLVIFANDLFACHSHHLIWLLVSTYLWRFFFIIYLVLSTPSDCWSNPLHSTSLRVSLELTRAHQHSLSVGDASLWRCHAAQTITTLLLFD